jgi:hypothetical protein
MDSGGHRSRHFRWRIKHPDYFPKTIVDTATRGPEYFLFRDAPAWTNSSP